MFVFLISFCYISRERPFLHCFVTFGGASFVLCESTISGVPFCRYSPPKVKFFTFFFAVSEVLISIYGRKESCFQDHYELLLFRQFKLLNFILKIP